MYGLMLPSGNDAAWLLAEFFGDLLRGSKKDSRNPARYFMNEMNSQARALGMKQSDWQCPHGIGNSTTTTNDMCILARECYKNSIFRKVVGTPEFSTDNGYTWKSLDLLLGVYPGIVGGKTGWTPRLGCCYLNCYEKDGVRLAIVIGRATNNKKKVRFEEAKSMLEWTLANRF